MKSPREKNFFSLNRKLIFSDLWLSEPFTKGQAWVDLIGLARFADGNMYIRGVKIPIKRGQVGMSELTLAKRWSWSRNKVRRFLKDLEAEQQIEQQKTNITSLISIKNYNKYQYSDTPNRTASGTPNDTTDDTTDGTQYNNDINNENNENNENNKNGKKWLGKISELKKADWFDPVLWAEYKKHRKKTTPYAEYLALKKLDDFNKQGQNPSTVINQTIENGWKGLFPVKREGKETIDEWMERVSRE